MRSEQEIRDELEHRKKLMQEPYSSTQVKQRGYREGWYDALRWVLEGNPFIDLSKSSTKTKSVDGKPSDGGEDK